jgi:hypothetical protein
MPCERHPDLAVPFSEPPQRRGQPLCQERDDSGADSFLGAKDADCSERRALLVTLCEISRTQASFLAVQMAETFVLLASRQCGCGTAVAVCTSGWVSTADQNVSLHED